MSDVKRYRIKQANWAHMQPSDDGDYVRYDDYATLETECDALWSTYVALVDKLGIDTEKAKTADGKPSDVIVSYVDALLAENERLRADMQMLISDLGRCDSTVAVPQACMGCVEQASRIRELEHKMDYYIDRQPSAGYVVVAEVMTGCLGKLNWLVMPNFKNGTKLYVEVGGDE